MPALDVSWIMKTFGNLPNRLWMAASNSRCFFALSACKYCCVEYNRPPRTKINPSRNFSRVRMCRNRLRAFIASWGIARLPNRVSFNDLRSSPAMAANQSPSSRATPRLNCCALGCHGDPSTASTCAPLPALLLPLPLAVVRVVRAARSSTKNARSPINGRIGCVLWGHRTIVDRYSRCIFLGAALPSVSCIGVWAATTARACKVHCFRGRVDGVLAALWRHRNFSACFP